MTRFEKLFTSREKLVKKVLYLWDKVESSSGGYTPPTGGIPLEHLSSGVQASLALADSALQPPHQDISGKQDKLVYEEITPDSSMALVLGYDYYVDGELVGDFEFTLADNPANGELSVIFSTGTSPLPGMEINIASENTPQAKLYVQEGFSIDANSTYEMNIKALNGSYYIVLVKMEEVTHE